MSALIATLVSMLIAAVMCTSVVVNCMWRKAKAKHQKINIEKLPEIDDADGENDMRRRQTHHEQQKPLPMFENKLSKVPDPKQLEEFRAGTMHPDSAALIFEPLPTAAQMRKSGQQTSYTISDQEPPAKGVRFSRKGYLYLVPVRDTIRVGENDATGTGTSASQSELEKSSVTGTKSSDTITSTTNRPDKRKFV